MCTWYSFSRTATDECMADSTARVQATLTPAVSGPCYVISSAIADAQTSRLEREKKYRSWVQCDLRLSTRALGILRDCFGNSAQCCCRLCANLARCSDVELGDSDHPTAQNTCKSTELLSASNYTYVSIHRVWKKVYGLQSITLTHLSIFSPKIYVSLSTADVIMTSSQMPLSVERRV